MKRLSLILGGLTLCLSFAWADIPLWDESNMIEQTDILAATVAWGDVNGDGLPDLFVGDGGNTGSQLFLRSTNGFQLADSLWNMSTLTNVRTSQFLDFNQDGLLDLFCLTNDDYGLRLFRNTTNHRFQEVVLTEPIPNQLPIKSAVWMDMNEDGALDIVLSNAPDEPVMTSFEQQGNQFVQVRGDNFPFVGAGSGALCVVDYDQDHDCDLFCGFNREGVGARLYRNNGGAYELQATNEYLPEQCGATGAVWTDVNNDQFPDLVLPGPEDDAYLLTSEPSGETRAFAHVDGDFFPEDIKDGLYTQAADLNMDGYQDLVVSGAPRQGARLLFNNASESWSTQTIMEQTGHHRVTTLSCALADIDHDGDLDIALAQGNDGVRILRNDVKVRQEWIAIRLCGTPAGTLALNCQVIMQFDECKQIGSTSMLASFAGSDEPIIYLASTMLNKSEVPELSVTWANGLIQTFALTQEQLNQVYTLYQPISGLDPNAPICKMGHDVSLTNAPNPFNPTTTLNFVLSENQNVRLAVFDLLGREVAVLADAPYQAGAHSVTFDASNLPSGLYFAQLKTATETKLHRMMLIK